MLTSYLILFTSVLAINVVPAFMPPTWTILSFFYIHYHLNFPLTVMLGVLAATFGRLLLYYIVKHHLSRFVPQTYKKNYGSLGQFLEHRHLTIPVMLLYMFSPIPSNQMFILAALSDMNIKVITVTFIMGRLISYSLLIGASSVFVARLDNVFSRSFSGIAPILAEIVGVAVLIILGRIPWTKLLPIKRNKEMITT